MADAVGTMMEARPEGGDIPTPVPHGQPAVFAVRRARERLEDELRYLASIEADLSTAAGTPPERHPDFWLGLLRGTCAYLLWALREQDKAIRRSADAQG